MTASSLCFKSKIAKNIIVNEVWVGWVSQGPYEATVSEELKEYWNTKEFRVSRDLCVALVLE